MNLSWIVATGADSYPRRPALVFRGRSTSYGELEIRVRAAAGWLRAQGVKTGDRVAIVLPNGLGFVAAFLGALRLGATAIPINPLLARAEIRRLLSLADPCVVVENDPPGDCEPWMKFIQIDNDEAAILFTSGTGGDPKGALLRHTGILDASHNAAQALGFEASDVILVVGSLCHVLGLSTGMIGSLLSGASLVIMDRFDPSSALPMMIASGVSVLVGVPTMYRRLCDFAQADNSALPELRIAHVGGAPAGNDLVGRFSELFRADMREGYGLTEMSGIATTYRGHELQRGTSVGRALGATEMRVVPIDGDVGEVQFRGPSVFSGFWRNGEATRRAIDSDGWLSTGDVGFVDGEGYLFLIDRLKDIIIRGGYKVYPNDVERALCEHPDILEAAVVGVSDDVLGEEVGALIVLRQGATITPPEVQAWAKSLLGVYEYPRYIAIVADLPKGATGKVEKGRIDPIILGSRLRA